MIRAATCRVVGGVLARRISASQTWDTEFSILCARGGALVVVEVDDGKVSVRGPR